MQSAGVVTTANTETFSGWSLGTGPQHGIEIDLWDAIEADLSTGDTHAAAARLRRGLEAIASAMCESLQALVPYHASGSWDLGEVLPASVKRHRELLKKARGAAESWGLDSELALSKGMEERVQRAFVAAEEERWMVNPVVHYNEWE
ncbi:MAG: hypothetical protein RLO18_30020, partial [Gimesia chilikensis]